MITLEWGISQRIFTFFFLSFFLVRHGLDVRATSGTFPKDHRLKQSYVKREIFMFIVMGNDLWYKMVWGSNSKKDKKRGDSKGT